MDKDGKQSDYKPFPCRKEPIGCQDASSDIRFLKISDGTPTFNSRSKFSAFNHGMLQDDDDLDESATKIFTSTTVDEETPRALKIVKRTTSQNALKSDKLLAGGQTGSDSKTLSSKFGSSKSQLALLTKGRDGENNLAQHLGYCPEKGYILTLTSPPPCQEPRARHPLGRHNSDNIKSTTQVSTVDNLSHKYQHFRESWDGSDRYLQMLEKYCDREDQPVKYTYLNSVYEPTTKPMEQKIKSSPLTKLRSSFRRHLNAMRNSNYKEMSPVLNPSQYSSSRELLKSNPGPSLLQCQNLPHSDAFHSAEKQCGMFYNACHSKEHVNSKQCSQDRAYRSSQSYAGSGQSIKLSHGYEQPSLCDHGCTHKRISYSENCPDSQQRPDSTPYYMENMINPENICSPNNPTSSSHYLRDGRSFYNQPAISSYLTLPNRQNNFPTGHTTLSAFSQCYPTLRNPPVSYPNYHYPSNDLSTYVVYSDKPSVNRSASAPPYAPRSYGSLQRNPMVGSRKISGDALLDHNDFRYCTVSSVRSESAPPSENFIRASFKSERRRQLNSDSFKSNQETSTYDFRQLTVSPVQSMCVPPDKADDLETLRNLTVSPVRSVSVMPNQSASQAQECFGSYSQLLNRSSSVPANFCHTYNPPKFPVSGATAMSDTSDSSFTYGTSTDRPTTPSSSQNYNENFYGKMTVCTDRTVSIPSVSQINYEVREKFSAASNSRTMTSSFESVGHNHQAELSDSPVFSYKHPFLPERKLSVPYSPPQSATNSDGDSQSVTSFSSLPDSTSDSLSGNRLRSNSEKEGAETDAQIPESQSTIHRNTNNENQSRKDCTNVNVTSQCGVLKEESDQLCDPETFKTTLNAKSLENYQTSWKNNDNSKSTMKMSSHVHKGVSIEPINSGNQMIYEVDPQNSQQDQSASLKITKDSSVIVEDREYIAFDSQKEQASQPSVHQEMNTKQETLRETMNSSSETNQSGIFGQQFTQSYAPIDPNQFTLQKFRDCTRSELYSPGISKTCTKKISSVDFYTDQSKPNRNSSDKSVNSYYALPSSEGQDRNSDGEEEERKKPQIPRNLPEEKPKVEQHFKNKNPVLSPLTIKQLKHSPLKLGRSLSISSADKSRLSKLRDKLSPLRIQNFVQSPFKFGRNIDLFDRKRWRSANDIVRVSKVEKNTCMLVKANKQKPFQSHSERKPSSKSVESICSLPDKEVINSKNPHGEDSDFDSDPSSLETLIDCDWALDVLDQLSRISDHHGSSFSDNSLKFTKYASWTDLPKKEAAKETNDRTDDLNGIPKLGKELKTNEIGQREAADGKEECDDKKSGFVNSNLKRNQTLLSKNQSRKENAIPDETLQEDFKSDKPLEIVGCKENIYKDENRNRNPELKCNKDFEDLIEKSEDIHKDNSLVQELDFKNGIMTYQEFKNALTHHTDSQDDLHLKEKEQKCFTESQDTLDETLKPEFCSEDSTTDSHSYLCEKVISAKSTDHTSNKSMTEKLNNEQSPQRNRTKTYNAGKTTERKRSIHQSQERDDKGGKKLPKELFKFRKDNAIRKNIYQDVKMSVVHEDTISTNFQNIQNMACWENWDHYEDEDDNKDENLEHFKNSLIQATLSSEMYYPWERSITNDSENNDNCREGAVGINFFQSDDKISNRTTHCYWPRSRYPKTVSRPVDPLLMPTIHEHKMMTEQFIYDDDEMESYHFNDPQLTVPAFELYDDRRSKSNKYSSYFRGKSLQSVNDTHPAMYMTVPMRDNSRAWNSVNHKNSFLEEFIPETETTLSDSHAFL